MMERVATMAYACQNVDRPEYVRIEDEDVIQRHKEIEERYRLLQDRWP